MPDTYVHGFDLGNWHPCWNLYLSGVLPSPDHVARVDPGLREVHRSVESLSLTEMKSGVVPPSVMAPRFLRSFAAGMLIKLGRGLIASEWSTADLDEAGRAMLVRRAEIELAFEEARRAQPSPLAVSRLSCLYLAEDSASGRAHVLRMLDDVHLVTVSIVAMNRLTRVDTGWFDAFCENPQSAFLQSYWRGEPRDPLRPTWEYLLDGAVRANDLPDLRRDIKAHGTLPPGAAGWPTPAEPLS